MKVRARLLVSAATVATVCIAAAGTASAQDAKCHAAIAKNIGKYQSTLLKTVTGCHKSRSGAKIGAGTDCNDAAGDADLKGKVSGAAQKVRDAIAKSCTDAGASLANFQVLYPRCPIPAADADGPNGIDSFAEIAECLIQLSDEYIGRISTAVQGNPDVDPALSKEQISCQGAIGKTVVKAISTAGKERAKCQATAEKTSGNAEDYTTCGSGDPSGGKITAAIAAVEAAINDSCTLPQDDLITLGLCGQTPAQLIECVVRRVVEPLADGLAAAAQELPGTCPSSANVIINAGYGSKQTDTRLDSGWTGLAHGVDVIDGYLGSVNLSNCDDDCDDCDVRLDPTPVDPTYTGTYSTCRCSNNIQTACDTINGPDMDQCGGNTCHCYFGPPLPLSSASTPVCVVNRFTADFNGNTIGLGAYDVTTSTAALVHLGINATKPCPTCDGDNIANDGVRNGSCNYGGEMGGTGTTCDVNATSADFGATSFDCQPIIGKNISGASGLSLALTFKSGSDSITAGLTGGACAAGTCHCMQCSGDSSIGCDDNLDCSSIGAGLCTGGTVSKQNDCDALDCDDAGGNNGVCGPATPLVTYCDGLTRADDRNGDKGILTCGTDSDCTALNSICPGGNCGTCNLFAIRNCFLPTITAQGSPGIFESTGISTFCTAQTTNPGVNSAGGLPGPGRVFLNFNFDLFCSNGQRFELPGGSNCP